MAGRVRNRGLSVRGEQHTATAITCGKDPRYGDIMLVFVDDDFRRATNLDELFAMVSFTATGFLGAMLKHEALEAIKPELPFKSGVVCPVFRVSIPDFERGRVHADRFHISDGAEVREWRHSTEVVRELPRDGSVNAARLIEMVDLNHRDLSSQMYRSGDPKRWFYESTGRDWEDCRLL